MSAARRELWPAKLTQSIPRPEQLTRRDPERGRDAEDVHEARIPRARLDTREVVPMDAGQVRKLLL